MWKGTAQLNFEARLIRSNRCFKSVKFMEGVVGMSVNFNSGRLSVLSFFEPSPDCKRKIPGSINF